VYSPEFLGKKTGKIKAKRDENIEKNKTNKINKTKIKDSIRKCLSIEGKKTKKKADNKQLKEKKEKILKEKKPKIIKGDKNELEKNFDFNGNYFYQDINLYEFNQIENFFDAYFKNKNTSLQEASIFLGNFPNLKKGEKNMQKFKRM
jgi:hypothetical protein